MLKASNIHYEMAPRVQAVSCGGIGAMHLMVQRLGLIEDLNQNLKLLKVHLPYHESDHVLNLAYNLLAGGVRLSAMPQSNSIVVSGGTVWRANEMSSKPTTESSSGMRSPRRLATVMAPIAI